MKKSLLFIFSISASIVFGQITKKVFFVGNSYTQYNDLPNLVSAIATSTGDQLIQQSHTPGGNTLENHFNNPTVTSTIALGTWDYVVLQEQSQLPSFPLSQVQTDVYPFAQQLSNLVNTQNPCGNVIFYMTWGRKTGDQSTCAYLPYNCTYEGMDDKLYERYMQMATSNESLISPVGKVWRTIRQQYPNLELYISDESHPSYLGSMAAAYTFYTIIFKKDPTLIPFNGNLSASDANILKNVVKNVVFNNMNTWLIPSNDANSQFSYNNITPLQVQFTNQTQNATTFLWNFGDGNTSTLQNSLHTYTNDGVYNVSLTTNACSTNRTKIKTLQLNTLSTQENSIKDLKIYPNPAHHFIKIDSKNPVSIVSLSDSVGRNLNYSLEKTNSGYQISLQDLPNGVYYLQYKISEKIFTKKFIKK